MAQVDAPRFLTNLPTLFAPNIYDGQEFFAYIDGEPNSLVIQGENILYPSSANAHFGELSCDLKNTSKIVKDLQNKADYVENLCKAIPGFVSNIENISGEFEGTPEFAFDMLYFDILNLREKLAALEEKINSLETMFLSINNSNLPNNDNLSVTDFTLERKFEALQFSVEALTSELHSKVVSENNFNVSD